MPQLLVSAKLLLRLGENNYWIKGRKKIACASEEMKWPATNIRGLNCSV
jgi:hypothetical protein